MARISTERPVYRVQVIERAQYQSGSPFSVRSRDDFAGVGPGSGAQFWNQIADPHVEPSGDFNTLQFRLEAFSVLNHPNWNGPNSNPTSGSFGLITGNNGERKLQLAAKYMF